MPFIIYFGNIMNIRSRSLPAIFTRGLSLLALLLAPAVVQAQAAAETTTSSPFTEAKFDDIVGDVSVVPFTNPTDKSPAKLNEIFKAPDTLVTGRRSRAQLKAADGTIARVGSQTAFSLEANSRTVHLKEGSILFNSPKGMGGGTIVTNAATATVLGTTIIVTATSNGGFKILVLEGHASVTYPGGQTVNLGPGQMTFVLPGTSSSGGTTGGGSTGGTPGPVLNFDLERQIVGANLINGFTISLPSDDLILDASRGQQVLIKNGELTQTNKAIVGAISSTQVILVDSSTITSAIDAGRQQDTTPDTGDERLAIALASTLNLATETDIPDLNIFLDPTKVTASVLGIPDGLIANNALVVEGGIAGDINASGDVVLNQFSGLPQISLLAGNHNTFTFTDDTSFEVPRGTYEFNLYSAGSFVIPEDIFIEASVYRGDTIIPHPSTPAFSFRLASVGEMNINSDGIENFGGNLSLNTLTGNLSVNNSELRAVNFSNSRVELFSRNASVSVVDSEIFSGSRGSTFVSAGGQITIDNSAFLFGGEGSSVGDEVDAFAIGNTSVTNSLANAGFTQLYGGLRSTFANSTIGDTEETELDMGAKTVVLSNVDLPSSSLLYLYSATGHLSVLSANSTPVEGDINFIGNVTIDGTPASDLIDEGVHLGITADNADVQTALASTVNLPTLTFPDSLFFEEVVFTPANLAQYYNGGLQGPFFLENGLIVGTLNVNGDSIIDEVSNVLVKNLVIGTSAELDVANTSTLNLYVLGNITNPNNTELDVHFDNLSGDQIGHLNLNGLGPLKLSHLNLFTDNAEIDLYGGSNSDLGISLDTVHLETSVGDLYFEELGDGSISIVNSTLDAGTEDGGQITMYTDYAGGITITNSNLTADGEIELYTGDTVSTGPNPITITGSNLTSSDFIGLYAGNGSRDDVGLITITSSNFTAPSIEVDGSFLNISNSTFNANDGSMSIGAYNTLTIANSTFDAVEGYDFSAYGLTITNSTFTSDDSSFEVNNYSDFRPYTITNTTIHVSSGIDINSNEGAGLSVVSSNLTTPSSIDIEAAFDGSSSTSDLLIQSSLIDSTEDGVFLEGDTSLAVVNSTIKGEDNSVELDGGAITVQDSILQAGPSNGSGGEITISGDSVVTVINSTLVAETVNISASADNVNSTINLNTVNFNAATDISIAARTVNLSNINFPGGSNVSLSSQNGMLAPNPNTGAQPLFGYVNFVTNVKYNNQPAQNFVPIAVGGSSSNPNAPIQITPLVNP